MLKNLLYIVREYMTGEQVEAKVLKILFLGPKIVVQRSN